MFQARSRAPFGPWRKNWYFSAEENNNRIMKIRGYCRGMYRGFGMHSKGNNRLSAVGFGKYSQRSDI